MIGQNIGKYRVLDRVGRGGMGTVFRALDDTLNRDVAIKILNAELNDPEVARRFRAEAVTVARLNHPGIATIFELFQHDGQWMMVMEFVRGETFLSSAISRHVVAACLGRLDKEQTSMERLTPRQREVLQLLAEGHTMKEAAAILNVATRTVAFHKYRIMQDFGLETNSDLLRFAIKQKLVQQN
jgi:serine/threonine protein kinase